MKRRQYANVVEMVRDICGDDFADMLKARLEADKVVQMLSLMRCARGITKLKMAERMGVEVSQVEAMENGKDRDLSVQDVMRWMEACGLDLVELLAEAVRSVMNVEDGHPMCCCSYCERNIAGDDVTPTVDGGGAVTLCPECYRKAGNSVR